MSLKKSAVRRLSLFAGSSIAAGFSAVVLIAAAPTAASAQSVCTPAPTSGAGSNAVTYSSGNQSSGIVCTSTGAFTLNKTVGIASSTTAFALDITSTGAVTINNSGGSIGAAAFNMPNGSGAVDFSDVVGGVTFTNAGATNTTGRWLAGRASVFSAGNDTVNLLGVGYNYLGGRNAAAQASIDFGAGNDTFNNAAFFNMGGHTQDAGSIDFGAGNDTFNINGVFASHGGTLANLETLNLSGVIFMGAANTGGLNSQVVWSMTDEVTDDVLRAPGARFVGSGDAQIAMDIAIGAGIQAGCAGPTELADCLDLRGGSTAGVTALRLYATADTAQQGAYDTVGITLVDVGGGTSAQGHFVLDPDTKNLVTDPLYGDVIDRPGLFYAALRYDPDTQRHVLASLPRPEVMTYAVLGGVAQSVWHMTAETVTDRQTDLRDGAEGAVWLRAGGEYLKRRSMDSFQGVGQIYTVDNSYKLYAGTITGGVDLISGSSDGFDYVLGAQIGYVSSSFDMDAAASSGRFTGASGGVYGGLWSDWFFLDGTVNLNGLTLDQTSPGLGSRTNTYVNSVGGRIDTGLRTAVADGVFAEPTATLSWVRTSFEELSLFGGEMQPAGAESARGALGLRLGSTLSGETASATYYVAGRAWYEFEGEYESVLHNQGMDLPLADEFTGAFGEAELGVSVFNTANTLSGYLSSGVKWKDGYNAVSLSLGVRMAW